MKKIMLIMIAVLGMAWNANAQTGAKVAEAIGNVGLKALDMIPDASYYIKVTIGNTAKYAKVSSCQMALEKAYDLLKYQKVDEVRIISENLTVNGSCRNKSYYPKDVKEGGDLQKRRDGWWLTR